MKTWAGNIKVVLDLCNYTTKADLEKATHVYASDFSKKAVLELDELDIDKLETVSVHLSKLNNIVDNHLVKKSCIQYTTH